VSNYETLRFRNSGRSSLGERAGHVFARLHAEARARESRAEEARERERRRM